MSSLFLLCLLGYRPKGSVTFRFRFCNFGLDWFHRENVLLGEPDVLASEGRLNEIPVADLRSDDQVCVVSVFQGSFVKNNSKLNPGLDLLIEPLIEFRPAVNSGPFSVAALGALMLLRQFVPFGVGISVCRRGLGAGISPAPFFRQKGTFRPLPCAR